MIRAIFDWMRDAGYEVRDAGYVVRDAGYVVRDTGYGMEPGVWDGTALGDRVLRLVRRSSKSVDGSWESEAWKPFMRRDMESVKA